MYACIYTHTYIHVCHNNNQRQRGFPALKWSMGGVWGGKLGEAGGREVKRQNDILFQLETNIVFKNEKRLFSEM